MAIISGDGLGTLLCEVLGLDKQLVKGLEIRAYVHEAAMVKVESYISIEASQHDGLTKLKEYKLVPIDQ